MFRTSSAALADRLFAVLLGAAAGGVAEAEAIRLRVATTYATDLLAHCVAVTFEEECREISKEEEH